MRLGIGGLLCGAKTTALDLTTLDLSGLWREEYAGFGSSWTGTASAGTSGGKVLSESTNYPYVGPSVNFKTSLQFDGDNDVLNSAVAITNFLTDSEYAGGALVYFDRSGTTAWNGTETDNNIINNEPIICGDAGYFTVCVVTRSGTVYVAVSHYHGSLEYKVAVKSITLNGWRFVHWEFKSGTLRIGVDGVWGTSVTSVNNLASDGTYNASLLRVGHTYGPTGIYTKMKLRHLMLMKTAPSASTWTSIFDSVNRYYRLPAGGDPAPVRGSPFDATTTPNGHSYATSTLTSEMSGIEVPRDGMRVIWFPAIGKFLSTGGWWPGASWAPQNSTNEVHTTTDLVTWTKILSHDNSSPTSGAGARFRPRHTHGMLWRAAGPSRAERVYVVGGDQEGATPYPADVWYTEDGSTWVRAAADAPWKDRAIYIAALYNDEIHIIGGYHRTFPSAGEAIAEHWVGRLNADDTVTWVRYPNPPFARFGCMQGVVHDGKLLIISGAAGTAGGPSFEASVWAFDGNTLTWAQQASSLPFTARYWIGVVSFDGKIWALTGRSSGPVEKKDTWYSEDLGQTWTEVPSVPWSISHADGIVAREGWGIGLATGFGAGAGSYKLAVAA